MRAKRAKVSERSEFRCVASADAFGDTHTNAFGVSEGQHLTHIQTHLGLDTHISEVHGQWTFPRCSQFVSFPPHLTLEGMLRHSFVTPSCRKGPPRIWDTHGISWNVSAEPVASSTAHYPQVLNPWSFRHIRTDSLVIGGEEWGSNTSSGSEMPVRTVGQKFSHPQWERFFKTLCSRPSFWQNSNGIIGPLNGSPKRLSHGVFPSDKRSWMFLSQIGATFHRICPPTFIQTWLQQYSNKIFLRWRNYENSRVLPSIRSLFRSSSRIRGLLWNYLEDYKNCRMK